MGMAVDPGRDASFNRERILGRTDITLADVRSGEKTKLYGHPQFNLYQAAPSPDGRWVAFLAHIDPQHSRIFIAPCRPVLAASADPVPVGWMPVTTGEFWDDKPRWSSDNNLLYFVSSRDGFLCLWAQRLDPVSRQPVGAPLDVLHFHNAARSMVNVGLAALEPSIARDQIILDVGEITGNVW